MTICLDSPRASISSKLVHVHVREWKGHRLEVMMMMNQHIVPPGLSIRREELNRSYNL